MPPATDEPPEGPTVRPDSVEFVLPDQPGLRPSRVWFHLRDFGADPRFQRRGQRWVARIPRPPVSRMEYLIAIRGDDGHEWMVPDPANPLRARGVFGEHSVVEFPSYRRPTWLDQTPPAGRLEPLLLADDQAHITLTGDLWCPADSLDHDPLPLLVVHDGPEYADLADLLAYLAAAGARRPGLRCRVLLLKPVDRDRSYSASPAYARTLMERALPWVRERFATLEPAIGVGASLGALALVHATITHPGGFGGLFLQSGSFFTPDLDGHESRYAFFERVVRCVRDATSDPHQLLGLQVAMTCGTGEENLDNNRRFAAALRRRGVPTTLTENPDGHNYTGWRDCLDPALGELMSSVWPAGEPPVQTSRHET